MSSTTTARDRLASSILDGWRVFTGITNLEMAEHLADCLIRDGWAPPADLPATLASVDDVRRVCEAAGLVASNVAQGRSWEHGLAYVESAGTGAVSSVVHHEVDGAERWTVEVYRGGPTVVLWHAIQAARSAS